MHRIEAYTTLAIIFILGISILYLPVLFFLRKKGICIARQLGGLLWFSSVFLILFATIFFVFPFSFNPDQRVLNLIPFDWLRAPVPMHMLLTEVVPNIALFIPLGLFTPILFRKTRKFYRTFLLVFLVTLGVETFQYFIGRSADIDDIIANFLGGTIGYLIFISANHLFKNQVTWNNLTGTSS